MRNHPATRKDWQNLPMPSMKSRLPLTSTFNIKEMEQVKKGLIPEQMEDKWFVFFEDNRLFFHRSWTGFCIFEVQFATKENAFEIVGAEVNREPSQYSATDNAYDARLLSFLIEALLLEKDVEFPSPSGLTLDASVLQQWSLMGRAMLGKKHDES